MIEDKGLEAVVADKIGKYVQLNGGLELLESISNDKELNAVPDSKTAIEEMKLLFHYLEIMGAIDKVYMIVAIYIISTSIV